MILFHDKVSYFLLPRTGSGVMKLMQNCLKHGCRDGQRILGDLFLTETCELTYSPQVIKETSGPGTGLCARRLPLGLDS